MELYRFGVAIANFRQPIQQALRTAVAVKARGIQLTLKHDLQLNELNETGRRQFLHYLSEMALTVESIHLPTKHSLYEQESLDQRLDDIRRTMELAWQFKCSILTLRIGKIPAETESREFRLLTEVLSDLAAYGNHIGATLCLIPTNDTASQLHFLAHSITTGLVGIDFDPAGFILSGQNVADALRLLHERILHIQARDAIRDLDGAGEEVAVGNGRVDWQEVVALLAEIPYRGWITINRTRGDHRISDSADAIRYLTELGFR